ncbi:Deoxycytidine kinase 1 [Taxawa tesnikishii (nom. ined.)]|nr:Deoxycytidine kinase 1 [Dothideales sp. JES 119]
MVWQPIEEVAHAVCVHPFDATEPHDLALDIGDDVYVTELGGANQEWCRGWLLAQPSLLAALADDKEQSLKLRAYSGIFPRNCVRVREVLGKELEIVAQEQDLNPDGTLDTVAGASQTDNATLSRATTARLSTAPGSLARRQPRILSRRSKDVQIRPKDVAPRNPADPKEQAPLPALRIGDATALSNEEPLVEEISSCLREWHSTKMHELMLNGEYELLDRVSALVQRLDNARKQMIHNLLTEKELADLRERVIWDLVDGNKMLDGEVIVRSPAEKGRLLTAHDSIPEILQLQAMMGLRNKPLAPPLKQPHLFHVLVDLKHFPWDSHEYATLHVYAIDLPLQGPSCGTDTPERAPRTLFVDLSKTDVGGRSDTGSRLFLVCKLQRDEIFRSNVRKGSASEASSPLERANGPLSPSGSTKGRRSFMFGSQRGRRPSESDIRPSTGDATRPRLQKQRTDVQSSPNLSEEQSRPLTADKQVRRVVGWSAVDVGPLIWRSGRESRSLSLWTSSRPSGELEEDEDEDEDDVHGPNRESEGWHEVLKSLCRSPVDRFTRTSGVGNFVIDIQAFAHSDADSLIKEMPALLRDIHCTRALALLGGSVLPRSDVYLTIKDPFIPTNARFFHPREGSVPIKNDTDYRNLQLTLEVRTHSGGRLEHAIYPTSNRPPHTAYRIPAVDRGEAWNQTIRFAIGPDDLPTAHIVMSIADGPLFPFALAWFPLSAEQRQDYSTDGPVSLALWDYSEFTASTTPKAMAALNVDLLVSSTYSTGNKQLQNFIEWGKNEDRKHDQQLLQILDEFKEIPDVEIDTLDTSSLLFQTVSTASNDTTSTYSDDVAKEALKCLVHALSLTQDRRFSDLQDFIGTYLESCNRTYASSLAMLRAFRLMFDNKFDDQESRDLRRALKVSPELIRIIMRTPTTADPDCDSINDELQREFTRLFVVVVAMLKTPLDVLLGTQIMVLQHFPAWLDHLSTIYSPGEITTMVEELIGACKNTKSKLQAHSLVMIREFMACKILGAPDIRLRLVRYTTEKYLLDHWLEPGKVITPEAYDKLRLCCSVIRAQLPESIKVASTCVVGLFASYCAILDDEEKLQNSGSANRGNHKPTITELFPTTYPFHTIDVDHAHVPKEAKLEILALLDTFFQAPNLPLKQESWQFNIGPPRSKPAARQKRRKQWLSFSVTERKHEVAMMDWLLGGFVKHLLPDADNVLDFDNELWEKWFVTLMSIASDRAVSMENFPDQRRRAVWAIGGDIRETAAKLLRTGWDSIGWQNDQEAREIYGIGTMGGYQLHYTTKFMPWIVRLCICLHHELRSTGSHILWAMISSEWDLNQSLEVVQNAMASAFDSICREGGNMRDNLANSDFLGALCPHTFAPADLDEGSAFRPAIGSMVQYLRTLRDRLLAVDAAPLNDQASRLFYAIRAAEYLRTANNQGPYILHLHDIAKVHYEARNFASAGVSLQMHAQLYEWDMSEKLEALPALKLPAETAFARKERLYGTMIRHFELGHSYRKAIVALEELAQQYENVVYDSGKAARALSRKAKLLDLLSTGAEYQSPRYFEVSFSHVGFPATVAGQTFIFEGAVDDDGKSFKQKMRRQYLGARIRMAHEVVSEPGVEAVEPTITIRTVTVHKDYLHPVLGRTAVSPFYREFILSSQPREFAYTRRANDRHVAITEQVVEKDIFTTAEAFPTLMGRSPVISTAAITLSPVQAAIDRTHRKTKQLVNSIDGARSGSEKDLSEVLSLVVSSVSADEAGSVLRYRSLVDDEATTATDRGSNADGDWDLTPVVGTEAPSERDMLSHALRAALQDHARMLERALVLPLRGKLQLRTLFEEGYAAQLVAMYPNGDWASVSPAWRDVDEEDGREGRRSRRWEGWMGRMRGGGGRAEGKEGRRLSFPSLRRMSRSFLRQ